MNEDSLEISARNMTTIISPRFTRVGPEAHLHVFENALKFLLWIIFYVTIGGGGARLLRLQYKSGTGHYECSHVLFFCI